MIALLLLLILAPVMNPAIRLIHCCCNHEVIDTVGSLFVLFGVRLSLFSDFSILGNSTHFCCFCNISCAL